MGQGVNIGLEDGAALLRVWDQQGGDRKRVCEAYQRERVAEGLACCDLSERAADLLLRMPPENPPPTPHPLSRLNFMGHRYADVARDVIPGWQPEIYAQAAAPALGDGLQLPTALLEPFDASPGHALFRQGDDADELLVLQAGSVQVTSPTLGSLSLRGPTVIGEMGWLGRPHRTASVTCETPCSLARLSYAKLDAFCTTQPAVALPLLRQLATLAMERLNGRFHRAPSYLILEAGAESQQLELLASEFRELLAGTALIGGEREAEILERSGLRLTRLLPDEHLVEALLLAMDAGELAGAVLFGALARNRQLTQRLDATGVAWTTDSDEARALLQRRVQGTLASGLHAVLTPA
jgi:CRP-like cAMP-binding protein